MSNDLFDSKNRLLICIPVYNAELYIEKALDSIINQTYQDFDVLILDDGSTDKTEEICRKYEENNENFSYINDGKNLGLPKRLNQSIKMCKHEYYCRMDADDIMLPKRIEMQVQYLNDNPEIDLIGSDAIVIDNEGNETGTIIVPPDLSNISMLKVMTTTILVHPSVMGRSLWFKRNPYNERLERSQDRELWARTVKVSNLRNLNTPLIKYRQENSYYTKKYSKNIRYALSYCNSNSIPMNLFDRFLVKMVLYTKLLKSYYYYLKIKVE